MFFRPQSVILGSLAAQAYCCAEEDVARWMVAESPSQYHPRHPERSAFYQLFETHFELDPLEWIHRITSHIPDPGKQCQRFYGAYSNRARICMAADKDENAASPRAKHCEADNSDCSREARSTWARLIKRIFEADPLLCPCGGRMGIISFITDSRVVDRILRHRQSPRSKARDPFEPRPPPAAVSNSLQ